MDIWMSDKEIELIKRNLKPSDVMMEWGSGGSTFYLSKLVSEYYSIEHDPIWFDKIKHDLPKNVRYFLKPPKGWQRKEDSTFLNYAEYVCFPYKFNKQFDKILIDGRARVSCAIMALNLIKTEGIVFIHDFWHHTRKRYHTLLNYYSVHDSEKTGSGIIALKKKI